MILAVHTPLEFAIPIVSCAIGDVPHPGPLPRSGGEEER
jgi:hypothetical protein